MSTNESELSPLSVTKVIGIHHYMPRPFLISFTIGEFKRAYRAVLQAKAGFPLTRFWAARLG